MKSKKIISVILLLMMFFQMCIPTFATTENEIVSEVSEETSIVEEEVIEEITAGVENQEVEQENEEQQEIIDEEVIQDEEILPEENIEINEEVIQAEETTEEDEIIEEVEIKEDETIIEEEIIENNTTEQIEEETEQNIDTETAITEEISEQSIMPIAENEIMLMSAGGIYVGNEAEFRNALALQADVIYVRQSIDFTSPIYINYNVRIQAESDSNALRYGNGGSFIVVQNGGSLVIDSMVIDTNSSGNGGMVAINIENGGYVTFVNGSIIDGGLANTGALINSGGSLLLWSSNIVRCGYGINLQANGNLYFATQEGRANNFYWNGTSVFIDNFYGSVDFNQNIRMYENTNGILTANVSGSVVVSAGDYYNNYNGINCGGNVTVTGGNYYSNNNGMCTNHEYSGRLTINNANIYSNTFSSVYHDKGGDNTCVINGGAISGQVYLAQNDNYINTNASYPTFTVTPSTYWFKRKLVKTNSNAYANNEIAKITLTQKDSWYKYVDGQYIVVWTGGNVIVRCKDYYGNVLKTVTMNGTVGTAYSVTAPTINNYDLIYTPSNAKGTYSTNDIVVELKYDLVNVAKVNFADLLSGVVSAKYWYNGSSENFSGSGTDFVDGTVFEKYGYYKITVINGVGLEKTVTFSLNKNSLTR